MMAMANVAETERGLKSGMSVIDEKSETATPRIVPVANLRALLLSPSPHEWVSQSSTEGIVNRAQMKS